MLSMEWKSVCSAVQGRGHAKKDIPCQDKVARREENGVHVIALADGAGSAALSHFGAQVVVNCATDFVAEKFFDLIAQAENRLRHERECRRATLIDAAIGTGIDYGRSGKHSRRL